MKILITAATEMELMPFKFQLNCINNSAVINSHSVSFAVTGVGITATAYNLTKILVKSDYDLVLNVGIAGTFSENLPIGTVAVVEREMFADWGVYSPNGFTTVFEENIVKRALPFDSNGELYCRHISPYYFLRNYKKVRGVTVNAVSGEISKITAIQHKFNPEIESMEGAAFFYVCLLENILFIEIRSISNRVENRNTEEWDIPLAIANLIKTTLSFLESI